MGYSQGANGVSQSWAGCRKPLLGAQWATSLAPYMNGRRKQSCHLVRPPIRVFMAVLYARKGWHCPRKCSLAWTDLQTYLGWLAIPLRVVSSLKNPGSRIRLNAPEGLTSLTLKRLKPAGLLHYTESLYI